MRVFNMDIHTGHMYRGSEIPKIVYTNRHGETDTSLCRLVMSLLLGIAASSRRNPKDQYMLSIAISLGKSFLCK
ncbi:hypothetical protein VTN77DRAFT_9703 [Rasamsonia byssochlamydoides]|uniref:uncharacterized protein n=1 Tax=Rasamsonia byssochlamydoides TaxID=89139 RepID=UPI0037425186